MGNYVAASVRENLRLPTDNTLTGWFVKRVFEKRNRPLELYAVQLAELQSSFNVLEIGFGPGIGLKQACMDISDGKVKGLDFSPAMVKHVQNSLTEEIKSGKLEVSLGNVTDMPYKDNEFHRVFHVNCYYFWDDMPAACAEIYRVMKEDSVLITTRNPSSLKKAIERNLLTEEQTNVITYMTALKQAGFTQVESVPYTKNEKFNIDFEAVFARKKTT